MRRFFVWSALAAVIGLALAGGGYWAYWNFYARFQPVVVSRNQAEIQRLLDESSWISAGGGGAPLYIVGYRDSAAMQRYEREEVPKLRAAGVEARIIVFARPDREGLAQSTPAERATVAELWLTRDWVLYQRWTATPPRNWTAAGIPAADGNLARSAVVDAGRDFVAALSRHLGEAGLQTRYPLIVWRDREGYMKACACSDSRSWAFIRDDLDAPDRIDPAPVAGVGEALAEEAAAPGQPLPYPALPSAPPAAGATPGADAPAAASAPAARPRPAPPAGPPAAPEAKRSDDTTFF
ncbi:MAG: hypothetical protein H2038_02410 [Brevundimonas sp.]|jgi:hypothetical protein|uniref:hypothetical protein n=1 Tax=Brevundimonas sp. TaxID=1871086 RepID=UPI0017CE7A84|nr:hypothetical protein [Brevundimonas sp.]MBA4803486.1 hypothetical protein [Brevundimonas sp.]